MRVFFSRVYSSFIASGEAASPLVKEKLATQRPRRKLFASLAWLCLLVACIGASWFAFQVFLVPQPKEFAVDWQDSRWVQAADNSSPVAYFRYTAQFDVVPDNAFVTVTASQVFRLYVNGTYIGSNTLDFVSGNTPQTYMFDIDATLTQGLNVVGLRVANVDKGTPQVRATVGAAWGKQTSYYSTGHGWQSTGQTTLAHPRAELSSYDWTKNTFDASQWQAAQIVAQPPSSPLLRVNPQVYEQPLSAHWISTTGGTGQESYYVRNFSLSAGFDNALLRIVATGEADVFINDHLYMQWNGQANVPQINVVDYLNDNGEPAPYRNGLMLGVYDISPYVHAGTNTLAIHVLAPGTTTAKEGLDVQKSALSADLIIGQAGNYTNPLTTDSGWHTSSQPVAGWTHESNAAANWPTANIIGRPGANHTFYLPDSNTPRNVQVIPPVSIGEVIAWSCLAVLAFSLFISLMIRRRYNWPWRAAIEATSLIWLPALALEALFMALSRESQLPQPFPYTWQWGMVLSALVALAALVLWLQIRTVSRSSLAIAQPDGAEPAAVRQRKQRGLVLDQDEPANRLLRFKRSALSWLASNWSLLPIMLFAIPMVCYDPAYEPYWQDELSSYYAARNIMLHGFPAFPSGFVYLKGELFSYTLALLMSIFGTTSYVVPRTISMVCFLASLPTLYILGSKLFNRKVAWLATAMLAFSPYTMIWSRQTRMYEMAQFMVIIVLFVFYWAMQHRDQVRPICIASVCLMLAYFSHEEVFIILPALVACVLLGSREGPYGFPAILRKKHWWIAALIGSTIIMLQLSAVFLTHPLKLGSDQSQRPQLQLTLDNIPYYFNLLFRPGLPKDGPTAWISTTPFIVVNSLLATLGCVLAFCRRDKRARYCALFLIISTITLVFVFTMEADRYYYPLLPVLYLMAAFAFWKVLQAIWLLARPYLLQANSRRYASGRSLSRPVRVLLVGTLALLGASVLLAPMLPLSNFNLFLSRITGTSYHQHYADYDNVGNYMHNHLQKGDVVVTIAPAVIMLYYVGQADDFFSIDRALFLFENNGQIVETTSGSHPLLNQADFQAVLAKHQRIWLISDNGGYQGGVTKNSRFTFPPTDFRMVYEGYGSAIYFRSAND